MANEAIYIRLNRLNNLFSKQSLSSRGRESFENILSKEYLLDAFLQLYKKLEKENKKRRHENISEFIKKHRGCVEQISYLSIKNEDFCEKALINAGSFSKVLLVSEKFSGDVYAMKKISKKFVKPSQGMIERFIMSQESSEWITNLNFSYHDSDYLYLIMDYHIGGNLSSLILRKGPFSEDIAKFYIGEIALALNELHQIGFCHKDVKPENILIDRFGHVKLADFGSAFEINKIEKDFYFSEVGTPDYISPEILLSSFNSKSTSFYCDACDFWALGIIAFEMVYLSTPFNSDNIHEIYSKIIHYSEEENNTENSIFPINHSITQNFKFFIQKLLTSSLKRLNFLKIKTDKIFENFLWESLHQQIPPFVPFADSEADVSNFNTGKICKESIYCMEHSFQEVSDLSMMELQFLGFSFVREPLNHLNINNFKLNNKIKDLQTSIESQAKEIKTLQKNLLVSEKKSKQSELVNKVLLETKEEIINMKENLNIKTTELIHCKSQLKLLQSSLEIEEKRRSKADIQISETLRSSLTKWEKAKEISDQNYEKRITETKTEINNLLEKMSSCKNEIEKKNRKINELQSQLAKLKELSNDIEERIKLYQKKMLSSKLEFIEAYEIKLRHLNNELKLKNISISDLTSQLNDYKIELKQIKQRSTDMLKNTLLLDTNYKELINHSNSQKQKIKILSAENSNIRNTKKNMKISIEKLQNENERLNQEYLNLQQIPQKHFFERENSPPFKSANESLNDINFTEEHLRNEIYVLKEREKEERCRADNLEKIVLKLENMIEKINEQPNILKNMLGEKHEKLNDKLLSLNEQLALEKQSTRAANLSLWKLEKKMQNLEHTNKSIMIQHLTELNEKKNHQAENHKSQLEGMIRHLNINNNEKTSKAKGQRDEVKYLKSLIEEKHHALQISEEKINSLNLEKSYSDAKFMKLEVNYKELEKKYLQVCVKNEQIIIENKNLTTELIGKRDELDNDSKIIEELQKSLKQNQDNYKMLRVACLITEEQLNDLAVLLDAEKKTNENFLNKIENLEKSVKEKEELISSLEKSLNLEIFNKMNAETRNKNLCLENNGMKNELNNLNKNILIEQKKNANINKTLLKIQEKFEINAMELVNMQSLNFNLQKEINILKEENCKNLTDLFLTKEENVKLSEEHRIANQHLLSLQENIIHMHASFEEQKQFYTQKQIKYDVTLTQHKKLIDYLQLTLKEYSQKKKSFTDLFFGTSTIYNKKEIPVRNIQKNVKLNSEFQDEVCENRIKIKKKCLINDEINCENFSCFENQMENEKIVETGSQKNISKIAIKNVLQTHEFEMNVDEEANFCKLCYFPILIKTPYLKCIQCKSAIHKKCRNYEVPFCYNYEHFNLNVKDSHALNRSFFEESNDMSKLKYKRENCIEKILKLEHTNALKINYCFEIRSDVILLGTNNGLYLHHIYLNKSIGLPGLKHVKHISVSTELNEILLVADGGFKLLQINLTEILLYFEDALSLKQNLEIFDVNITKILQPNEKLFLVEISNSVKSESSSNAIAVSSFQIIIFKFDFDFNIFKAVRSFDFSENIKSILFTANSAIICAKNVLSIDMQTYTIKNFLDFSDENVEDRLNCHLITIIEVSLNEFLLCFCKCGIFVDQYGCRSRSYELKWTFTPTGFFYKKPFLYISHFKFVQILSLELSSLENTSYLQTLSSSSRKFFNIEMSKLFASKRKHNCFILAKSKENQTHELYLLDAGKAFKAVDSYSKNSNFV